MQNFKVQLAPHITLTEIDGKLVLFSKQSGDFFGLNESAVGLIKSLLETDFLTTLKRASGEYNETESVLRTDLIELIKQLEDAKILKTIVCE